jgi:hypothetical protein
VNVRDYYVLASAEPAAGYEEAKLPAAGVPSGPRNPCRGRRSVARVAETSLMEKMLSRLTMSSRYARGDITLLDAETEEALTVLFCLIDDAYALLNPKGRRYEPLKRLSDWEVITLALLQQLRGVESERSFLRDAQGFFPHLFPGVVGLHPSSLHRRVRKP